MNLSRDIGPIDMLQLVPVTCILLIAHDMAVTSILEVNKEGLVVDNLVYICLIDTESVKSGRSPTT